MIESFIFDIIDWIVNLFQLMDDIIVISAGNLSSFDISLFDVSISLAVVGAIIHVIFSSRGVEWEDDD